MASFGRRCAGVALLLGGLMGVVPAPAFAQLLIVGNDEKQGWDANGKAVYREPGKDTLSVIDISKPDAPQIAATIPLMNSVVGPPTNLAIHPVGRDRARRQFARCRSSKAGARSWRPTTRCS